MVKLIETGLNRHYVAIVVPDEEEKKTLNDSLNKKELSLRLKRLKESKRTISFAIMS